MEDLLDQQSDAEDSSGGWLKFLDTAGSVAGKVLGALGGNKTNSTPKAAATTSPTWLPYALIGGGVLLLVVIVSDFRK